MKETRLLMGMPITVEIVDADAARDGIERIFAYFTHIDEVFSTYKETSEISRINRGEVRPEEYSAEVRSILALSEETKRETSGYFDIQRDGLYDPSGIVKGWSIQNAALMLRERGSRNFYIDAGGDIAVAGRKYGNPWRVGIRNPFNRAENVKALALSERGIATSGTAIRGQHIYNPHAPETPLLEVASLTVIGPNVYEADRFATAAFAMGRRGIYFIEQLDGFEGYMIDVGARATMTTGFERYVLREP
ncbi:MAG TPA: FAD:protein FMN transferase [Ktedonobacteraceae bacterium]|nr:FAD:protein FMN transferase [Ktedonobacteraceae bacterium]